MKSWVNSVRINTRRRKGHQYEGRHCEKNSFIDNDASKGTLVAAFSVKSASLLLNVENSVQLLRTKWLVTDHDASWQVILSELLLFSSSGLVPSMSKVCKDEDKELLEVVNKWKNSP